MRILDDRHWLQNRIRQPGNFTTSRPARAANSSVHCHMLLIARDGFYSYIAQYRYNWSGSCKAIATRWRQKQICQSQQPAPVWIMTRHRKAVVPWSLSIHGWHHGQRMAGDAQPHQPFQIHTACSKHRTSCRTAWASARLEAMPKDTLTTPAASRLHCLIIHTACFLFSCNTGASC